MDTLVKKSFDSNSTIAETKDIPSNVHRSIKCVLIILNSLQVIQDWIRTPLKVSLQTTYRGDTATDPVSVTWNLLMIKLSCCGVDNGRDFEFSRFNRDFTLQIFNQTLSISNLQTPLACCNSASRRTAFEPGACAKYPIRKDHTHYFEGCLEKIWSYVTQYSDAFILAAVSIQPLLQALQVILTCVFMELLKREMEDRKRRKSRTYRKGSDFFFPSVSEESLM
uniref:Uncharacterized protein n=1 Tax=Magallana gigas TaxID=29159 RepID=K1PV70_MAGGI